MSSDSVDIAIVCPDSAREFLKSADKFVEVGECIQNSSIIVSKAKDKAEKIGYPQNRYLIQEMVNDIYGEEVEKIPLIMQALPYSLENGTVDAVVIDITEGMSVSGCKQNIEFKENIPTHVILASTEFMKSREFENFRLAYNEAVSELSNPETFRRAFENYKNIKLSEKDCDFLKESNMIFKKIEAGECE